MARPFCADPTEPTLRGPTVGESVAERMLREQRVDELIHGAARLRQLRKELDLEQLRLERRSVAAGDRP
jgi:hypothetical protein